MNEYDDIAQLFARASSPAPNEAFISAVRQKIEAGRRARVGAFAAGLAAAIAGAIALLAVPLDVLYPLMFVHTLLMSAPGVIMCAAAAIIVVAMLPLAEV